MTRMTVSENALSKFIVAVLTSSGMQSEDAGVVADVLTWANLRGVDSHGVARLPGYVSEIAAGQFDPVGRPLYRSRLPGTFVLECSGAAEAAQKSSNREEKIKFLEMAQAWRQLAEKFQTADKLVEEAKELGLIPSRDKMN